VGKYFQSPMSGDHPYVSYVVGVPEPARMGRGSRWVAECRHRIEVGSKNVLFVPPKTYVAVYIMAVASMAVVSRWCVWCLC
jgi:hypothetical protein